MKRKRHTRYDVTSFTQGLGWDCKNRKWCEYEDSKGCWSSRATFRTFNRAKRNAIGLSFKTDKEVIVMQWFRHNGKRYCREYYLTPPKEGEKEGV